MASIGTFNSVYWYHTRLIATGNTYADYYWNGKVQERREKEKMERKDKSEEKQEAVPRKNFHFFAGATKPTANLRVVRTEADGEHWDV